MPAHGWCVRAAFVGESITCGHTPRVRSQAYISAEAMKKRMAPLKKGGNVVGAIGVSGGSGEQDHAVAEAGAAAFGS